MLTIIDKSKKRWLVKISLVIVFYIEITFLWDLPIKAVLFQYLFAFNPVQTDLYKADNICPSAGEAHRGFLFRLSHRVPKP